MNKQFLVVRTHDGLIHGTQLQDDPDDGPTIPQGPCPIDGAHLVPYDEEFTRAGRRSAEAAYLRADGQVEWVDHALLSDEKAAAIAAIDATGEALRLAVINRMPTQTEEYRQALQQARDWRAAGYPETPDTDEEAGVKAPPDVASWAMAKHRERWTDRQAADDILDTADSWAAILSEIRLLRLVNKEDVRHAATIEEITAIRADMVADMRAMAQQQNLTLPE